MLPTDASTGGLFGGPDFQQTVTLKNSSGSTISGPLALDNLTENVSLDNRSGLTGYAAPLGSPFTTVNLGADGVLSAGETATVTLLFSAPSSNITYTARVLAGPDPR